MTIIALNCIYCDLIPPPTNPVVVGPEKGKLRRDACLYMARKYSFPHLGLAAFFRTDPDQKSSPTITQCHDSGYLRQQCESTIPPIFPSLTMCSIRTILKSILPPPFRGSLKTPQPAEIPVSQSPAARPQPESLRTESQGEPESNVYPGTVSPQRLLEYNLSLG